jgi:hypothetical protein
MPPRVGHAIVRALVPGGLSHLLTRQAIRAVRGNSATVKQALEKQFSHASDVAKNVTRSLKQPSKSANRKQPQKN